jgi:hypothetical protein
MAADQACTVGGAVGGMRCCARPIRRWASLSPSRLGRPQGHGPEHVGGQHVGAGAFGVADGPPVVTAGRRVVGLVHGQPGGEPGRLAGRRRELAAAALQPAADERQVRPDRTTQLGRWGGRFQPPEPARHRRDGLGAGVGAG